jgi:hypothetical protein
LKTESSSTTTKRLSLSSLEEGESPAPVRRTSSAPTRSHSDFFPYTQFDVDSKYAGAKHRCQFVGLHGKFCLGEQLQIQAAKEIEVPGRA